MVVLNKADLLTSPEGEVAVKERVQEGGQRDEDSASPLQLLGPNTAALPTHHISCATGAGLGQLETALADAVRQLLSPEGVLAGSAAAGAAGRGEGGGVASAMITRERHRRHVKLCVGHLERFLLGTLPMDAAAEEIRYVAMCVK